MNIATVENCTVVPQTITTLSSNSTFVYQFKRIKSRGSHRQWYTHVHSSITHKSQAVAATQETNDGSMGKQRVVHAHNGILFSPLTQATMWTNLEEIMLSEGS